MKRILVAGATGYLGGFVAREFKSQGHFVRALARSPEKLARLRPEPDEVVAGEVTRPVSLDHVCDDIDIVFSSIGITRQKDKLTFRDVDYQGNKNLLAAALGSGVKKFIYVSVFNGPDLLHLDIVKAHEDFVNELKSSGIDYAVVRPTGYFSDMTEFYKMAKKGRVYLIGPGTNRCNPIHGADLAKTCVDAVDGKHREIDVGGPQNNDFPRDCRTCIPVHRPQAAHLQRACLSHEIGGCGDPVFQQAPGRTPGVFHLRDDPRRGGAFHGHSYTWRLLSEFRGSGRR